MACKVQLGPKEYAENSVFTVEILWNPEAISNNYVNVNAQHQVHIVLQRTRKLLEKVSVYFLYNFFVGKVHYFKAFECCIMENRFEATRIRIKISYCAQDTLHLRIHSILPIIIFPLLFLSSLTHIIMPEFSCLTGNYPILLSPTELN